jgi:pimeloyl-ACP methyl ester carboxylesterase
MDASTPFHRGAFEALPERPRIPHPYFEANSEDVVVESEAFGPVRTRVVTHGPATAPPLLLVHGLMTSSYSWRYLLEPLGGEYRLIVPDLPGCGQSQALPERRHSGRALGSFVGDLQKHLGIVGCDAIGNSLGGYICMQRALQDPSAFDHLLVLHAPGLPQTRLRALHLALAVPGVSTALSRVVRRDPQRWAHRNVHYYDESLKSLEEAREYGAPLESKAGAGAFIRYLADSLDPSELRSFVGELEARRDRGEAFPATTMLAYAREDPMVPPAIGPELHRLVPGAEFRWLEDTSHFAHVDTPTQIAELSREFLATG